MNQTILPDHPPMLSITGNAIAIPPRFASALASVIVEWSRVETMLITDLEGLRRYPGIDRIERKIPPAFDPQLKLWRKSVAKLYPEIKSYQIVADHIFTVATDLAPKRNHLVHGQWDIVGAVDNQVWTVRNLKKVKGGYEVHRSNVNIDELEGTVEAILKLGGDISGFFASRLMHFKTGLLGFVHIGQ